MKVLVIGLNGRGLSPTTSRKARILVNSGKASVVRKVPFTIRLNYKTGVSGQETSLGVDTGSQHIGIGVKESGKAVVMSEYALRSTMEKRSLNEKRRMYRRGRRYRKTRYRKPKFKLHTKRTYSEKMGMRNGHMTHWIKKTLSFETNRRAGWLPSSIESKIQHHIDIIQRYRTALPDNTVLRIEAARFDQARMKDSTVHGELYQKGRMYDYENVKAYVFSRDGYKCRVCGCKAGTKRKDGSTVKLVVHHIDFRSKGATDNPDRMASVCDQCHNDRNHREGGMLYKWMVEEKSFSRGYRDATFMNILRRRLWKAFPDVKTTYGNITAADREAMGLPKSHANDALAIASKGEPVTCIEETTYYQQVRSRKRSLHEANPRKGRGKPNKEAKRNSKNTVHVTISRKGRKETFHVYDKVEYMGRVGWISGFTGKFAYVKDRYDQYIKKPGATYNQVNLSDLKVLSHNNNWLVGALCAIGK